MIAVWWSQYGEYVDLRFYPDWAAFEIDRADVEEMFTSYSVMLALPVVFS